MFTLNVLLQNELPFFFLSYLLTKRICFILTTMTILLGSVKKDQSKCGAVLYMCMFEALVSKGTIIPLRAKRAGEFIEIRHKQFHPPEY